MSETSDKGLSPIYVELASESDNPTVTQIESLCLQCQENVSFYLLYFCYVFPF